MFRASVAILLAAISVELVQSAAVDEQRTCYDPLKDAYPYYSTRTAYERVHGTISRSESSCKPLQIWMLSRHGTRYPAKEVTEKLLNIPAIRDQIVKNHENGAGTLCESDLLKFKMWKLDPDFNVEMDSILAPQGKNDLFFLAQRLQLAFPELLLNARRNDFFFQTTDTQRTIESMESFATGLFGDSNVPRTTIPLAIDTLLQPFDICPVWNRSLLTVDVERDKFTAGPEFQNLLLNVSQRLGYNQSLDFNTIRTLYDMCRYEEALHLDRPSVWCSIFSREELQILEYREDLGKYYVYGPGQNLTAKMSCQLVSNMFKSFKRLASGSTQEPKGIFYFAHSLTLGSFLSALKIGAEDEPLQASGYATSANRKFRSSILGSFATNVVAVFYECNDGSNKVTFHVGERLTPLASCNKDGTCDWESLEHEFEDQINDCNMGFCFEDSSSESIDTEQLELKNNTSSRAGSRSSEKILVFATVVIFASRMTFL